MSPKKPVESLRAICIKSIGNLIETVVKGVKEDCVEVPRHYFDQLPFTLKDTLLLNILNDILQSQLNKLIAIDLLGHECSMLCARMLSPLPEEDMLKFKHLRYLKLTGREVDENIIKTIIGNNPSLRAVIIPGLVTDEILAEISKLSNLEYLHITGIFKIERPSKTLEHFKKLSIHTLGITNSNNSSNRFLLSDIICCLPNLQEIRYLNCGELLAKMKKPFISKLRSIIDIHTTPETMEAIMATCPELEHLDLENPKRGAIDLLQYVEHLKSLKISMYEDECSKFELNIKKLTLFSLNVHRVKVDFMLLCITLEELVLLSCTIIWQPKTLLRNLKVVELLDCNPSKDLVMSLLKYCNQLIRMSLSTDVGLTDDDIDKICCKKQLKCLEELWLSSAKLLTTRSVSLLMKHCDQLILLGTLNGWDIDRSEINHLRCHIYFSNIKLNLVSFHSLGTGPLADFVAH